MAAPSCLVKLLQLLLLLLLFLLLSFAMQDLERRAALFKRRKHEKACILHPNHSISI
jgi:hypothetical protein